MLPALFPLALALPAPLALPTPPQGVTECRHDDTAIKIRRGGGYALTTSVSHPIEIFGGASPEPNAGFDFSPPAHFALSWQAQLDDAGRLIGRFEPFHGWIRFGHYHLAMPPLAALRLTIEPVVRAGQVSGGPIELPLNSISHRLDSITSSFDIVEGGPSGAGVTPGEMAQIAGWVRDGQAIVTLTRNDRGQRIRVAQARVRPGPTEETQTAALVWSRAPAKSLRQRAARCPKD